MTIKILHLTKVLSSFFLINIFTALKEFFFKFHFLVLELVLYRVASVKRSLRTSSILQIIYSVWSFEISEGILRKITEIDNDFRFIFETDLTFNV